EVNAKIPLQSFPFIVQSDDDAVNVSEGATTNGSGELQVKVNAVEPVNQTVGFSLSPDIRTVTGADSVGRAGIALLSQFIQTPALKVYANVTNITIYVQASEKNFGKPTGQEVI